MLQVKTADAAKKLIAAASRATSRIIRHLAHRCCDERGVPAPTSRSPPLPTGRQNLRKVCSREGIVPGNVEKEGAALLALSL
jgi:hypothetical protein